MRTLVVSMVLLVLSGVASAQPMQAVLVARVGEGGVPRDDGITALKGESVEVWVLVRQDGAWYGEVEQAEVDGRVVSVRPWAELGAARVQWRRVEPRMVHPAGDEAGARPYTNAVLTGRSHGQWQRYDRIEYFETVVPGAGPSRTVRDSRPSDPALDHHEGLGTLRWAARVQTSRGVASTSGADATTPTGIDRGVMRISFREGPDLLGWLAAYFNVPQVFGSAGGSRDHQTDRFVGADCADVVVGALRAAGHREVLYTGVWGLTRYAPPVTPSMRMGEQGRVTDDAPSGQVVLLRWGSEVKRGDLVILDYLGAPTLPRPWDHVGVLGQDDGDGVLDADDLLWNMSLDRGLVVEPLGAQGAVRLQILRVLPRHLASPRSGV